LALDYPTKEAGPSDIWRKQANWNLPPTSGATLSCHNQKRRPAVGRQDVIENAGGPAVKAHVRHGHEHGQDKSFSMCIRWQFVHLWLLEVEARL
jgi:hypothetical protein